MNPEDSVGELLDLTLNTINAVFEQANVPLPECQYIYVGDQGETVHDGEQVTVSLAQLYAGTPGDEIQVPRDCDAPLTAVLIVEIVRCIPMQKTSKNGKPGAAPTPAELSAMARTQARDQYLLMQAGLQAGVETNYLGSVPSVVAGPPSGGLQAQVLTLVIAVP